MLLKENLFKSTKKRRLTARVYDMGGRVHMVSMVICPAVSKKLLEEVPHRKVEGIEKYVLIYRNIDTLGWGTVITHQDACFMGMTEAELYELARSNLRLLRDGGIGNAYIMKSLYEDALMAAAFVPELLEEYLEERKTDKIFVSVSTGKIFDKIADVIQDVLHGMEVLCFVKDRGFVTLQQAVV